MPKSDMFLSGLVSDFGKAKFSLAKLNLAWSADRLSALTIYFKKINNIPKLTTVCLKIKFRSAQTVCLI